MKDKTKLKILTTILIVISFFVLKAMDVDDRVLASLGIFDSFYGDIVVTDNVSLDNIPPYEGYYYITVNNNEPFFKVSEITTESYEVYYPLDSLGRATKAESSIGKDLMPQEKRGDIGSVKPTGFQYSKYDFVDNKYLYNRCHLIAFMLTGENANKRNLITCTRSANVKGMLPFEQMVGNYVKATKNHVMYRVTPIYEGDNLVASGILMEAYSVEDSGEGIKFNVYIYNVEEGVKIDYSTGNNSLDR